MGHFEDVLVAGQKVHEEGLAAAGGAKHLSKGGRKGQKVRGDATEAETAKPHFYYKGRSSNMPCQGQTVMRSASPSMFAKSSEVFSASTMSLRLSADAEGSSAASDMYMSRSPRQMR